MYKTTRSGVLAVALEIGKSMMGGGGVGSTSLSVRTALDKMPWLDGRGKSDIYGVAVSLIGACKGVKRERLPRYLAYNLDDLIKAFNRAYKRMWVAVKKRGVMTGMRMARDRKDPIVFYLVSSHQKPQPAHKDLQGKLLVDYYWKSTLSEAGKSVDTVGRFIKNRKIRTVQWAMGEPHYLITRVNCRHYLIPVKTSYVLSHTLSDVRKLEQPRETGVRRPLTDAQRWAEYKELRATVLRRLEAKLGQRMQIGR